MKTLKKIPTFKTLDEEREFWEKEDSIEYLEWEKASFAKMPNLKKKYKDHLFETSRRYAV